MSVQERIQKRMNELGIVPKRSLGQNFLVSDHVVEKIVMAAKPASFDHTIEIGPGLGSLTDLLKEKAQDLLLVELDKTFSQYWREQGLSLVEVDALKYKWSDLPFQEKSYLLVSNLPYQISSRLVVDLSILGLSFERMVLMFQKEVAQRMVAPPGHSDYGLLSVVAQTYWYINLVLEAGAVDFNPKPNVASRVLVFDRKPEIPDFNHQDYLEFLKIGFANRRKKLLPKLVKYASKEVLAQKFSDLGIPEGVRVEKLGSEELSQLYTALKSV